jgi:hypothetical protein
MPAKIHKPTQEEMEKWYLAESKPSKLFPKIITIFVAIVLLSFFFQFLSLILGKI